MTFEEANKNPKEEDFGLTRINIKSLCKMCKNSRTCWFSDYDPIDDIVHFDEGLTIDCNFFEKED